MVVVVAVVVVVVAAASALAAAEATAAAAVAAAGAVAGWWRYLSSNMYPYQAHHHGRHIVQKNGLAHYSKHACSSVPFKQCV